MFVCPTIRVCPPPHVPRVAVGLGPSCQQNHRPLNEDLKSLDLPLPLRGFSGRRSFFAAIAISGGFLVARQSFFSVRGRGFGEKAAAPQDVQPFQINASLHVDPVVSTDWLKRTLGEIDVVVLDVRSFDDFAKGHIPGATHLNWTLDIVDQDNAIPNMLVDGEKFATIMQSHGINDGIWVVLVGDFPQVTRVWWALKRYGHDRVSVLDGSYRKWAESGGESSSDTWPDLKFQAPFTIRDKDSLVVDAEQVLKRESTVQLIDSREPGVFEGKVQVGNTRPGHIPGAVNVPTSRLLHNGALKSNEELKSVFEDAGVVVDKPTIAYCNQANMASVAIFALYKLGNTHVSLYDGSWAEWGSREELPAERTSP
mmetsp:Transcript_17807/g.30692  ORF Transcript_17807/g.30692 Transcript_17807/m.30692 type:complete len:368 (-) Transcript_17807:394-1497(-)